MRLIYILLGIVLFFMSGCSEVGVAVIDEPLETIYADSNNVDAFGRLRVSEVTSSLDIKQLHDKEPLFIDELTNGTGSSSWEKASINMSTSASGDYVIRQTFQRGYYQNGKSQLILLTFDNFECKEPGEKPTFIPE